MSSKTDHRQSVKKITRNRSVAEQRTDRRQRLVERFKFLRIQCVDHLRHLEENKITYELLAQLKDDLLANLDEKECVQPEEIQYFLDDINEELKVMQYEQQEKDYEKFCMDQTEDLISNLLTRCDICDDVVNKKGVCSDCFNEHFNTKL